MCTIWHNNTLYLVRNVYIRMTSTMLTWKLATISKPNEATRPRYSAALFIVDSLVFSRGVSDIRSYINSTYLNLISAFMATARIKDNCFNCEASMFCNYSGIRWEWIVSKCGQFRSFAYFSHFGLFTIRDVNILALQIQILPHFYNIFR